jgi:hypothetical protein
MLEILKRTYCSTLGVEFMHISDAEEKGWIQQRIEGPDKGIAFTENGKKAILNKLIEAEGFEKFLDVKYTGTKRFGLDGGESLVPALEQIIKRGGQLGVKDIVLGMAHRGRLNVLSQVMEKPHRAIFHEFKGGSYAPDDVEGSGDVKYHLGASSDREFDGNNVHLSLTANPSHLEIVNPVVLGKVRAKQDQVGEFDEKPKSCRSTSAPRSCRCCCMAMPPLQARVLWPSASGFPGCAVIARPARSTSSSTIRLASPPIRASRVPRPTPPTWRRWSRHRYSIAMAMIRNPSSTLPRSPSNSGRSSTSRS